MGTVCLCIVKEKQVTDTNTRHEKHLGLSRVGLTRSRVNKDRTHAYKKKQRGYGVMMHLKGALQLLMNRYG